MPQRPIATDEPTVHLHARVRESHARALEQYAAASSISMAAAMRKAVEDFITRTDVRSAIRANTEKGDGTSA